MIRPVLFYPDERLRIECQPVEQINAEVRMLAYDMTETMIAKNGRGLSAPQIGVLLRMFVMRVMVDNKLTTKVVINPVVVRKGNRMVTTNEGCLSLPGIELPIKRSAKIELRWLGLDGLIHEYNLKNGEAICAQHELDHLDGVLTIDHVRAKP
jgi:peptide deformylase